MRKPNTLSRATYIAKSLAVAALIGTLATACDDNTSSLGIYSLQDELTTSTGIYQLTTRSVEMDSVVATSTISYLGRITDPETEVEIEAEFAAQFYTFENYEFPKQELMLSESDELGVVHCDSTEVRLYFEDYYGDDNNPLKVAVYELSAENIIVEDSVYYTTQDLSLFLSADAEPLCQRVIVPMDYNVAASELTSSTHSHNVRFALPQTFGQSIMEKYYESPSSFVDSYHFIREVFPGLLFRTTAGEGSMYSFYVGTVNVYFHYQGTTDEGNDTIMTGVARFSATPEVIQTTRFEGGDISELVEDQSCTWLKTPASICTEVTLPIDEIFSGEHAADSLSLCALTFTRYNKEQDDYQLGTPQELLLVRKGDYKDFFLDSEVSDDRISYTTSFSSTYNTYTFNNVCRLLAYCKHEKMTAAEEQGISEEEWAEANPDWNKVLLVPVTTSSNTSGDEVSVQHDLSLGSIRLVGGDENPISFQVVYSKFYQE